MTLYTLERPSLPIQGMQGNLKRMKLTSRTPHRYNAFPPPLESPAICEGHFSHLSPVDRVCFTSVRRDGRLILAEKPQHSPPRRHIRSQRSNGRLQLRLYVHASEQNQHHQANPIDDISSFQHEQHCSLARNLLDLQEQQLKRSPYTGNALLPIANNFSHGRCELQPSPSPSARGQLPAPIQRSPFAELGKEEISEAENARHHVCMKEQRALVAPISSSVAHRRLCPMARRFSAQPFQDPSAEMGRQESPSAGVARERKANAEIANPTEELKSKEGSIAEMEMQGRLLVEVNAGMKRNPRAQKARGGHERASPKQSRRAFMKCDAYLTQAFKPYDHFFFVKSTPSLAFLNNSIRPSCMLNL